jgi:cholesterol transport system auxiliary component
MRLMSLALVIPLVGGCMLARSPGSVSIIAPQLDTVAEADWPEVEWAVLVQRPVADQMRNSDRVLVRVSRSRLQPWPEAAWLDSMPDMVHGLMIQSLEDSGRFAGVGRVGGMRSRFGLISEIRSFEAVDDGSGRLVVELGMRVNLVHQPTGRVMATRSFEESRSVDGRSLDAVVIAFEEAMVGLFADITGWLLSAGEEATADVEGWRDRFSAPRARQSRGN